MKKLGIVAVLVAGTLLAGCDADGTKDATKDISVFANKVSVGAQIDAIKSNGRDASAKFESSTCYVFPDAAKRAVVVGITDADKLSTTNKLVDTGADCNAFKNDTNLEEYTIGFNQDDSVQFFTRIYSNMKIAQEYTSSQGIEGRIWRYCYPSKYS